MSRILKEKFHLAQFPNATTLTTKTLRWPMCSTALTKWSQAIGLGWPSMGFYMRARDRNTWNCWLNLRAQSNAPEGSAPARRKTAIGLSTCSQMWTMGSQPTHAMSTFEQSFWAMFPITWWALEWPCLSQSLWLEATYWCFCLESILTAISKLRRGSSIGNLNRPGTR